MEVLRAFVLVLSALALLVMVFAMYFFWSVPQRYRRWEAVDRARRAQKGEEDGDGREQD